MRGSMIAVVLLSAGLCWAEPPRAGREAPAGTQAKAHEKEEDTPTYILRHVGDENEFGFQIPLSEKEIVLHFPVWRVALRPGSCPADPEEPASLGAWCLDLSLTKHAAMLILGTLVLLALFFFGANRNPEQPVPHGPAQNLLELLVLFVRNEVAIPNIGREEGPRYVPYLLSVFFFILVLNLFGLIPFAATATGNIGVTAALAACTFVLTQVASVKAAGVGGYLKHLTGGLPVLLWPIMIPVEIVSLFTKPFALTLRLFANMLSGHIVLFSLLGLIFILGHVAVAVVAVPFAVAIFFLELFIAFLQAYIFAILSALFIGMGVAMGHHHAEPGHGADKSKIAVNPANAPG